MLIVLTGCATLMFAALSLVFYGLIRNQAINVAVEKGDINAMSSILDEHPDRIEHRNQVGWTPLHVAAYAGQVDAMRFLIQRGADINAKWKPNTNDDDWTALHIAVNWGRVDAAKGESTRALMSMPSQRLAKQRRYRARSEPAQRSAQVWLNFIAESQRW